MEYQIIVPWKLNKEYQLDTETKEEKTTEEPEVKGATGENNVTPASGVESEIRSEKREEPDSGGPTNSDSGGEEHRRPETETKTDGGTGTGDTTPAAKPEVHEVKPDISVAGHHGGPRNQAGGRVPGPAFLPRVRRSRKASTQNKV